MTRTGHVSYNYPRAVGASAQDGALLGRADITAMFVSVAHGRSKHAVDKWVERSELPLADGPVVNGARTWRRNTILVWAFRYGRLRFPDGEWLPCRAEATRRNAAYVEAEGDPLAVTQVSVLRERDDYALLVDDEPGDAV